MRIADCGASRTSPPTEFVRYSFAYRGRRTVGDAGPYEKCADGVLVGDKKSLSKGERVARECVTVRMPEVETPPHSGGVSTVFGDIAAAGKDIPQSAARGWA